MSLLRVLLNDEEIELSIERTTDSNLVDPEERYEIFIAKNSEYAAASVVIYSLSGIVKKVKRNGGITVFPEDSRTSAEVILQRAQDALTEFLQDEDSGIEGDIEVSSISEPDKIKPYDPDEIKVRSDKFSIDYVVSKLIERELLDLNPDFQRKFVWDRKRQSRLIESILLGIPIPFMYLSESVGGKFNVVDGLQRLSTFKEFLNNKFRLNKLEHLQQYEGCYFNEKAGKNKRHLDLAMQTRIETFQLYFNIIDKSSPNDVKYDIFERLNTGGLALNAQEIRNCNAETHVRKFLNDCANSTDFIQATDESVTNKRMDDQELVLRFAGFYLDKMGKVQYTGNMRQFLNTINEYLNKSDQALLDEIKSKFLNSMKVNFYLFGKYAFRKCLPEDLLPGKRKVSINKAMFIAWSIECAGISYEQVTSSTTQGSFAKQLADYMQMELIKLEDPEAATSNNYYQLLSISTFDVRNINETIARTHDILTQYNFI